MTHLHMCKTYFGKSSIVTINLLEAKAHIFVLRICLQILSVNNNVLLPKILSQWSCIQKQGDLDYSHLFQEKAQQQDLHIQNPVEFGTLVIMGMFSFYSNEQIY